MLELPTKQLMRETINMPRQGLRVTQFVLIRHNKMKINKNLLPLLVYF